MITIPIERAPGIIDLVIILQEDSLKRIQEHDPAEIDMSKFPEDYACCRVNRLLVAYASPSDSAVIAGLAARQDRAGIMKFLLRGWKFLPQEGDSDKPYETL